MNTIQALASMWAQTVKLSANILKLVTRFTCDDLIVKLFWIPCKTASWGWRQLCVYLSTGRGWQSRYFIGFFWLHLKIICLNFKKICPLVFMFVLFFLCLLLFLALLKNINFTCFVRNSLNRFKPVNEVVSTVQQTGNNRGGRQRNHPCLVKSSEKGKKKSILTFLSLSLSFFFSCFSLLLFFLGSCVAASPSSTGLFGASAARCALTGSFSLSASGLTKQQCRKYDFKT